MGDLTPSRQFVVICGTTDFERRGNQPYSKLDWQREARASFRTILIMPGLSFARRIRRTSPGAFHASVLSAAIA